MAVFEITDESGASYFASSDGDFIEERKKTVDNYASLPPEVQAGWMAYWEKQATGDEVTGLEGVKKITTYLKLNKKRTSTSDAARRELILAVLSVSLEDATKKTHSISAGGDKVDLITAMQKTLGVPLGTLASWVESLEDKAVLDEIKERAKAQPAASTSPA